MKARHAVRPDAHASGRTGALAFEVAGVTKRYGATLALDAVDLAVGAGTVHALVGENGAGKSTLLGVLAGRVAPDAGSVRVGGRPLSPGVPRASRQAGIAAIQQELAVLPALSAEANVFVGQTLSKAGLLDRAAMRRRFAELAELLGAEIAPGTLGRELSVADQQLVEIMRALQSDARLILLDEPTAPLPLPERDALFAVMRGLRERGVTSVLVSHNLEEVLAISDEISVFRDGRRVATRPCEEWTKPTLIEAMLGHELRTRSHRRASAPATREAGAGLAVEGLTVPGRLEGVDLRVGRGEVLGVAGLVGAGRTTLLRAIAGLERAATGRLSLDGAQCPWPHTVRAARALGIALLPEDRKREGLVLGMTATTNVVASDVSRLARCGVLSGRRERVRMREIAPRIGFDPERADSLAGTLSGGNQQKLLFGRWRHAMPAVFLADEPTRGVDVGAKEELLACVRDFANEGACVVMVSSELEEVLAVADRVIVLAQGRLVAELANDETATVGRLLRAAFEMEGNGASHN